VPPRLLLLRKLIRGSHERVPAYHGSRWSALEPPIVSPIGIEPMTYALREARHAALGALPAPIAAHLPRNALSARRAWGSRSTIRSTPD